MAADPVLLTLLVGLGLRELSMTPAAIPLAKRVIRGLRASEARAAASRALNARTATEIEKALGELAEPTAKKA
jgi:phosphoenolpyruvate-protein kinase (PTS system EI component)